MWCRLKGLACSKNFSPRGHEAQEGCIGPVPETARASGIEKAAPADMKNPAALSKRRAQQCVMPKSIRRLIKTVKRDFWVFHP